MLHLSVHLCTAMILINVKGYTFWGHSGVLQHSNQEVVDMSVLLFPVVAFGLAVVVGRIGTVMFREQEPQA